MTRARWRVMRALPLAIWTAACGGHATTPPSPPASQTSRAIGTGDPLPAAVAEPSACAANGGFRWLGLEPHVPLAVSDTDGIDSAVDCCAAWAHAGDVWTAVDRWGAPQGPRTVTDGEGYDVTQCYELGVEPDAPATLLVRGDRPWTAPPPARWTPSDAERAAALTLVASLDAITAPPMLHGPAAALSPAADRLTFFQLAADDGDPQVATHYVAIGGRALVIAGLDPTHTWRVAYLDTTWSLNAGPWIGDAYQVIGVFDLDGDGFPEVVVHRTDGPSWDDAVLRCDHASTLRLWRVIAESVGGSTA